MAKKTEYGKENNDRMRHGKAESAHGGGNAKRSAPRRDAGVEGDVKAASLTSPLAAGDFSGQLVGAGELALLAFTETRSRSGFPLGRAGLRRLTFSSNLRPNCRGFPEKSSRRPPLPPTVLQDSSLHAPARPGHAMPCQGRGEAKIARHRLARLSPARRGKQPLLGRTPKARAMADVCSEASGNTAGT
jgi:hypothetical protein